MSQALVQESSASAYSVECAIVEIDEIGTLWPTAILFLEPAFKFTKKLNEEDALASCMAGDAQLWAIWSDDINNLDLTKGRFLGSAVTELQTHVNGYKILTFLAFGATQAMDWVHDFVNIVEAFAVDERCHAVEMKGRQGWGRVFPDYPQTAWTYTKELPR